MINWFLHPLAMLRELPLILYEQNTIYEEQMYNLMDYKKTCFTHKDFNCFTI